MTKKEPTLHEKDIQNFVKTLLKKSDEENQLMYGRNVKLFDNPDMRHHLISQLKDLNIGANQLTITPKTLKDFYKGFTMGIAKAHYNHTTNGNMSPQEFLVQNLDKLFSLSLDSLLIDTKFRTYRKYFFRVIPSNFDKEKSYRISEFLRNIDKKEFYALGQQMTNLNLAFRKLHRGNKPITISVIDQHKHIYDLCCSCIEKYLKLLYGIKKAYDGTPLEYDRIKNTSIYKIKKELLESNDNYRLLLKPFITILWNADKHSGTIKYLAKEKIKFIANEGVKMKTFSSFIQLTKELCAVTFLLSRYGILLKAIGSMR